MVFSTVQISMPGTSWARAIDNIGAQNAKTIDIMKAIRPIIVVLLEEQASQSNCCE
jgi:hypothetical protein